MSREKRVQVAPKSATEGECDGGEGECDGEEGVVRGEGGEVGDDGSVPLGSDGILKWNILGQFVGFVSDHSESVCHLIRQTH